MAAKLSTAFAQELSSNFNCYYCILCPKKYYCQKAFAYNQLHELLVNSDHQNIPILSALASWIEKDLLAAEKNTSTEDGKQRSERMLNSGNIKAADKEIVVWCKLCYQLEAYSAIKHDKDEEEEGKGEENAGDGEGGEDVDVVS